ncbi:MAG: hypothetical protein FRX49_00560 [Trebouxia sp. A1-2]|nr:MAG: hypothetical protein FRX49_00560 [Trebouxia sp. A1-2]
MMDPLQMLAAAASAYAPPLQAPYQLKQPWQLPQSLLQPFLPLPDCRSPTQLVTVLPSRRDNDRSTIIRKL